MIASSPRSASDGAPDAPAGRPHTTRAEELRVQIADEITRGQLPPGTTLDETALAARFGVSRTPVREAIRELAASGLVDTRPHRGAVVARPSLERLKAMFEVMAELEALCAGLCATRITPPERHALEMLHAEMGDLMRQGDFTAYRERNEAFHAAIHAGAHNDYLAELASGTRHRLSPFRRAQIGALGRLALSHQEHERVVTAILRGDREGAGQAMREHISVVHDAYEAYTQSL
ncbi:GntR family transcriptional regulator [Ancylobacter sp. 6x-1]|uniref:GntR family transcriptional regulator n=1 Tax=Ancylobacter crimeensis TaxID=2579147 RepID=A0ABT0DCG6_9HYPH|nr:GntR family transcriptional regulator [Ancylobacter crimeensis]MCK0197639.1 GntR family transcriptional regulator [Ancylobacter crimeensis]